MKKRIYIFVFSVFTLFISAQNKKGNSKSVSDKENLNDKELTNYLLNKFSASDKVEFDDISAAAKSDPDAVTSLKLRKQGLTEVPSDISKFKNLVELDLSDNEITDFSSKLNDLPNLKVLNLSGNQLTTIPRDICNLTGLKTLNLSSNKIASGSLSCLNDLERLYLNNNELVSLPSGITEMKSLKALYLHTNKLTGLDEKLAKLENLEVLFVQFNKINEEPIAFKANGIINYIFAPQTVNNKHLYKYISKPAFISVKQGGSNTGSETSGIPNVSLIDQDERIENEKYHITSVNDGNGYRRIKVDNYNFRKFSKFRLYVWMPIWSTCLVFPIRWVLSKKFRSNYRLSIIHHMQHRIDKITSKETTVSRVTRVNLKNKAIIRLYKGFLRSNHITAN